MDKHVHVKHCNELIHEAKNRRRRDNRLLYYNDIVLDWITNHVLASVILFDIALIVPLVTLNASDTVKITLGVISSSWIQWWALPALQRSQNKTQAQMKAKAEVDHQTLTYLARLQDEQMTELKGIAEILRNLKNTVWLMILAATLILFGGPAYSQESPSEHASLGAISQELNHSLPHTILITGSGSKIGRGFHRDGNQVIIFLTVLLERLESI
jgi:hypothetical protein